MCLIEENHKEYKIKMGEDMNWKAELKDLFT